MEATTTRNRSTAVDPDAFSELFSDTQKHRAQIWLQMAEIVKHASRGFNFRCATDNVEARGDALIHAMERVSKYDPARRKAYHFFYAIIWRKLSDLVCRRSSTRLDDRMERLFTLNALYDSEDGSHAKIAAASMANPRNWKTFRVQMREERRRVKHFFQSKIQECTAAHSASDSKAERAAIAWMVEAMQQSCRALSGERIGTTTFPTRKDPLHAKPAAPSQATN